MTVLVGVLCKDGVVIGSDSASTFSAGQTRTIEQQTKKIDVVGDGHVIVAGTGAVGLGQRFNAIVDQAWNEKLFSKQAALGVGKALATAAINDFASTHANQGQYGALVAFPCANKPQLCEFAVTDFQPELKSDNIWYVSMGSGQAIADPFLGLIREVFWHQGQPTCQDAVFAVTWTVSQAIKLNPGGVNAPIQIAVMNFAADGKLAARLLDESEIGEHMGNVDGAIQHLRTYAAFQKGDHTQDVPDLPKP